jgi:hypothetical protein
MRETANIAVTTCCPWSGPMGDCPECGAADRRGSTCREQWHELLALEFSDPRAGAVHFLTVACYELQHPTQFDLHPEARQQLADALRSVVLHGRSVDDVRRRMGEAYDGSRSVLAADDAAPAVLGSWSHTVADVGPPDPEVHVERVRACARSVVSDLRA